MAIFMKGNSMKTKTFELDGFVFELSVETLDHLLEHECFLCWWM